MAMNNSLAEVHPELVSEWSEKNLPLTPDDITFGSNKKVWWRGACGHEWQTSVKARSNGEKCPICSGARVIAGINDLATLEPLLVKQWSKKNKIKPTEVSIGSHKKVIWRCEKGHEWEAAVKSRTINRTGCPYCSHNKVLGGFNDLATLLPDIAAEWSDRNYPLLPTQVTVFANRKAWWKCKDCGREWNTLISTHSGGSKCPYCSGYIFLKGFNDLQTTHPEIASEWSEKNLPLKPDEVNAKSRKNVWWRCGKCGNEWKSVINARVKGKKVIIRTLDIGADKQVDYFNLGNESNPALGYRAIRICLKQPDIFKTQLRALLRAVVYGNLSIMYPMITSVEEVEKIYEIVKEVEIELKAQEIQYRIPEQGIMIETPAAVMISDYLAELVDFFSIGTNDLTQYTLAIDRQNEKLDNFYNPHHEAVMRMIQMVVDNAHKCGKWVGICGELGADLTLTEKFVRMGVDELSVAPSMVLKLRKIVRKMNVELV